MTFKSDAQRKAVMSKLKKSKKYMKIDDDSYTEHDKMYNNSHTEQDEMYVKNE